MSQKKETKQCSKIYIQIFIENDRQLPLFAINYPFAAGTFDCELSNLLPLFAINYPPS